MLLYVSSCVLQHIRADTAVEGNVYALACGCSQIACNLNNFLSTRVLHLARAPGTGLDPPVRGLLWFQHPPSGGFCAEGATAIHR